MTPENQGRFCMSCQKTVVDFTAMTDYELIQYFKNVKGNTCGRFTEDQLHTKYDLESKRRLNWFKYFIHILFPTLLFSTKSYSQGLVKSKPTVCNTPIRKGDTIPIILMGKPAFIQPAGEITGKVTNERGEVLAGANIFIKGKEEGLTTDADGYFILHTKHDFPLTLSVSYVGYESMEILVDEKRATSSLNVVLNEKLLDEVVVRGYSSIIGKVDVTGSVTVVTDTVAMTDKIFHNFTRVIADSVKTAFGISSLKMYPNPISVSSLLTIEYPIKKDGDYKIEIFDISGRLIKTEVISIHAPLLQKQIRLNQGMAAGTYLVSLSDPNEKRIATQKLIAK